MKRTVYNQAGSKAGEITLSDDLFGVEVNHDLLYQAVRSYGANKRQGTAHTKDRSEVSGGGRKPWKQKGTGRARHGSIRSPIWVKGGITFGPRKDKKYKVSFPKKMRRQALYSALSSKAEDRELFILDKIELKGKTKEMRVIIDALRDEIRGLNEETVLIALDDNPKVVRAARNLDRVRTCPVHTLNAYEVLKSKYLILTESSAQRLEEIFK